MFLFPFGDGRGVVIAGGFLLSLPGCSEIFRSEIVIIASAAEGSGKRGRLRISGEEPVFEGLLYYHRIILQHTENFVCAVNRAPNPYDAIISIQAGASDGESLADSDK